MAEITIILAVVAVALIPLVGVFIRGAVQTGETVNRSMAVELAAEALEIMKSMSFDFLSGSEEHPLPALGPFDTMFDRAVIVTEKVPGELILLEARVTWKEQERESHVVLRTLVANPQVKME